MPTDMPTMMNTPSNTGAVVTRFAPSPTGYLHIGGARTALFNWLYARHHGGKFLLRIEDTDRARHNEAAVQAILDGLNWLGVTPDETPVSQYAQQERHSEIALQLLENGHAYRCYLTSEELDLAREKAMAEKIRFESPWRNKGPDQWPENAPYAIRFRGPQTGETVLNDAVQGRVAFPNHALDDLIILRSGADGQSHGGPTYNLAVVVDDHDMSVTHVIRGDDHLINGARQQQIYQALDWPVPVWAHIPLIHGADGKKLSKRHGSLGVEAYRDDGYLSAGITNYLLRLGWAHGNKEIIPLDEAIKLFDLDGINKSPARLDLDKLNHVNSAYMRDLSNNDFIKAALPFLGQVSNEETARLERATPFLKERSDTLTAVKDSAAFLLKKRPLEITGKAEKPLKKEGVTEILTAVIEALGNHTIWEDASRLETTLQAIADARNVGFGQIGQPVRASLTAGSPSPSLGEVLFALGPAESLARLKDRI